MEFIGLDPFAKSAKSFDLAFRIDKIKTKCKSFGYGFDGKISAYHLPYLP